MVYEVSAKRINPWARELDYNPDYYSELFLNSFLVYYVSHIY